jgi:transcriptional regulator with XRE-family HTH domain
MHLSDNFNMGTVGRGRPASEVPTGNNFGAWLRERRRDRDLTGEALAFRMGGKLTQSSISHYERGTKKPEATTVFLLAQALGADPREALEALMADTPGLEPLPEIDRIPEETLLEHIELYTGDNPVLVSAREFQKALAAARTAGPVGGEEMPGLVRNGRGAKKRIQDVDK